MFWSYSEKTSTQASTFGLVLLNIRDRYLNWGMSDAIKHVGVPLKYEIYDTAFPLGVAILENVLIHRFETFDPMERMTMDLLHQTSIRDTFIEKARASRIEEIKQEIPPENLPEFLSRIELALERNPDQPEYVQMKSYFKNGLAGFYNRFVSEELKHGVEVGVFVITFKNGEKLITKMMTSYSPDRIDFDVFPVLMSHLAGRWLQVEQVQFFHNHPGQSLGNILLSGGDIGMTLKLAERISKHLAERGVDIDSQPNIQFNMYAYSAGIKEPMVSQFGITLGEYHRYIAEN